jgi:uncharacterized protein with HEPN domain
MLRELALLQDIVDAGRLIEQFVAGCDFDTFAGNLEKYWATISQILVLSGSPKHTLV